MLEFTDCWKRREELRNRYHFTALLLEDVSGEYREWLGHQSHRGRPLGANSDVLETEVRFSVAAQETRDPLLGVHAPASRPFLIQRPEVEELSSPQLDMLLRLPMAWEGVAPAEPTTTGFPPTDSRSAC